MCVWVCLCEINTVDKQSISKHHIFDTPLCKCKKTIACLHGVQCTVMYSCLGQSSVTQHCAHVSAYRHSYITLHMPSAIFWITVPWSRRFRNHVTLEHPISVPRQLGTWEPTDDQPPRDRWYMDTLGSSSPAPASKPKPCPISVFSISWTCVHMYIYIYMYISVCVNINMCILYIYICVCVCTYLYIYIYMHMHMCPSLSLYLTIST